MGEPQTADDIEREFPEWQAWLGTDRRFHARMRSGSRIVVHGEDLTDLRDQVIKWLRQEEHGPPHEPS